MTSTATVTEIFSTFPLGGANAALYISTGTSFVNSTVTGLTCSPSPACNPPAYGIYTGDFDGDGKTDVAMVIPHYLKIFTWQNGGLSLALTVNIDLPQIGCSGYCAPGLQWHLADG